MKRDMELVRKILLAVEAKEFKDSLLPQQLLSSIALEESGIQ
jgi:hypothetical protein